MKEAIEEFTKYTNNYLKYGDMIKLKINHTLRVVDLCERIAKSLNLTEEEIYISKIIGLLHDIGRFEQWKQYNTFVDAKSVDHADFGVSILKENNYLRKYIETDKYDDIILKSIEYHNKFSIPDDLDKKTELFVKLIRDADKLDILYLYITEEITIKLDGKCFEEDIYKNVLNRKLVKIRNFTSKTNILSVPLGFVFDINYKESFKYLYDKKYFDTIIDMYINKSTNDELKEQLEEIRKVINEYIEVNLC